MWEEESTYQGNFRHQVVDLELLRVDKKTPIKVTCITDFSFKKLLSNDES